MTPLVSIALCGRNDNYGFAFKRRLVQAINFTAWSAERIGMLDRLEIIFTDWNSERPISEDLKLIAPAATITRFISVPPEIAKSYNFADTPFHTDIACNVAYRRARGEFVGMMPADNFLTRFSLRALFALLGGEYGREDLPFDPRRSVLSVPRKNFHSFCREELFFTSPEEMERRVCAADPALPEDCRFGLMSGFGLFLVHRELMAALRGFNENNGGWGLSDVDIGERALLLDAPVVNLGPFGISCYDFVADVAMIRQKSQRSESLEYHYPETAEVNSADWGLGQYEFAEARAATTTDFAFPAPEVPKGELGDDEILWRLRDSSLHDCPKVSRTAVELARRADREHPGKVVFWGVDPGAALMISVASPFTEIVFAEGRGNQMIPFLLIDDMLKRFGHHGRVTFVPLTAIHDSMAGADWHILIDDIPEEIRSRLPQSGIIPMSKPRMRGGFSGNVFSRTLDQRDLDKAWSIFGRIPLFRWPGMWRKIRPRVRACRDFYGKKQ